MTPAWFARLSRASRFRLAHWRTGCSRSLRSRSSLAHHAACREGRGVRSRRETGSAFPGSAEKRASCLVRELRAARRLPPFALPPRRAGLRGELSPFEKRAACLVRELRAARCLPPFALLPRCAGLLGELSALRRAAPAPSGEGSRCFPRLLPSCPAEPSGSCPAEELRAARFPSPFFLRAESLLPRWRLIEALPPDARLSKNAPGVSARRQVQSASWRADRIRNAGFS